MRVYGLTTFGVKQKCRNGVSLKNTVSHSYQRLIRTDPGSVGVDQFLTIAFRAVGVSMSKSVHSRCRPLPLIALAVLLVVLVRSRLHNSETVRKVVAFVDALGTPAFAVVGLQLALQTNIHLPGVLLIGCKSGMGGGLIRDILLGEIPEVMKPGHYLVIPLIGVCILFLSFTQGLGAPITQMAWIAVAVFFVIRVLTLKFDWQTTPLLKDDKS